MLLLCMPVVHVIWRLLRLLTMLAEGLLLAGGGSDRDGDGVPDYDWPDGAEGEAVQSDAAEQSVVCAPDEGKEDQSGI